MQGRENEKLLKKSDNFPCMTRNGEKLQDAGTGSRYRCAFIEDRKIFSLQYTINKR